MENGKRYEAETSVSCKVNVCNFEQKIKIFSGNDIIKGMTRNEAVAYRKAPLRDTITT